LSDLLAKQVLYNLALAKNFYEGTNYNGIPSFVTLASGQAQVQDSVTPQLNMPIFLHGKGNEFIPQVSGTHQVQDNWSFTPVVDPGILNRLYWLYRSQFTYVRQDIVTNVLFPTQPDLDQWGRPNLNYVPKLDTNGVVQMTNNEPMFIAAPKPTAPTRSIGEIPGAWEDPKGTVTNGWFLIPTNKLQEATARQFPSWFRVGTYLDRTIYITNRENFVKFAMLALGGTNGAPTLVPRPFLLLNQNGLITIPRP
jgi:hypothetical protein